MIAAFRYVQCPTFSRLALGTELRRLNGLRHSNVVVYLPQSGDRLRRIKDNGTQKGVQRQRMGILLCEQNFRDFGAEMSACGQKFVKFCTLTHTHAAKLRIVSAGYTT